MTRKNASTWIAWACLLAAGCEPGKPDPIAKFNAPHGGVIFDLPDKRGSVEIAAESAKDVAGASKENSHQIAAYFYQADGKTLMSPSPANVEVFMGDLAPIPLSPQDLPEKAGRFASPPGPYAGEIRGKLTARVGGEPVEVAFVRR